MKITMFFLFALLGWGQIERPQLGMMLDANGAVRPVHGTPASATLGEPVLTGVLSFGCSAQVCLFKTATATHGAAAYVYFPQTQRLIRWHARQLRAVGPVPEAGISPNISISEDQVRLTRPDGSEAAFDVAGVQQFFAMGKGYVQLVAKTGMWMLRVEPGREQIFLLPGIDP